MDLMHSRLVQHTVPMTSPSLWCIQIVRSDYPEGEGSSITRKEGLMYWSTTLRDKVDIEPERCQNTAVMHGLQSSRRSFVNLGPAYVAPKLRRTPAKPQRQVVDFSSPSIQRQET